MKTPETLNNEFSIWKAKKGEKLLKLYQEKFAKESSGEDKATAEEKISEIEKKIAQRQARLEKDLARLYERMYKAGASTNAKKLRQERTHHLCNLGGLVEKSGLEQMDKAALLGMLIQQKEYLDAHPGILNSWAEKGQTILNEKKEEMSG